MPRSRTDRDHIVDYTVRSHSSKTRLIAIIKLTATLGIIYTSLHNHGLSEYQLSPPLHTACYYIQREQTGHGERGKVGSSKSVAAAAHCVCVVCCVGRRPDCHHLLDRVHSLLHTGLQIPARQGEYLTPDYRAIKARPTGLVRQATATNSTAAPAL